MKIAILPNFNKENAHMHTVRILKKLHELGITPMLYAKYRDYFNDDRLIICDDFYEMVQDCDKVITIGGDGTIIHAAKHAAVAGKPVLGINLGRVGFVAGLEPDELDRLEQLVSGDYQLEQRAMLSIRLLSGETRRDFLALNDVVISRGSLSRMIDLQVSLNEKPITGYRADGLILSTPTGSTAYSLSAGGPVVDPSMRAILLTPICPHSLFSRTVLFGESARLAVSVSSDSESEINLTIDGETSLPMQGGDVVAIELSNLSAELIRLKDRDFYEILNEKLAERRRYR